MINYRLLKQILKDKTEFREIAMECLPFGLGGTYMCSVSMKLTNSAYSDHLTIKN